MGLSFIGPLFLAGLAALAVPILMHLSQKTKREAVPFPSLMFLSRVPYKEVRRQRIRNWVLFLLRSIAIVVLVLAFARPLLEGAGIASGGSAAAREVVVLLDRSASMTYENTWDRAVAAAQEVIAGLGPQDRATVVTFADHAQALQGSGRDAAAASSMIDRIHAGSGATRYGPAIELADQILRESPRSTWEVVMISDFQRSGWDGESDAKLPPGAALTGIDVAAPEPSNVAITEVTLERGYGQARETVTVLARIANLGAEAVPQLPVTLTIDGDPTANQRVDLPAHDALTVRFPAVAVPDREVRGLVQAGGDPMPFDNASGFMLSPGQALSVLVLEDPDAPRDGSLYIERALGIGSEPPHRVTVATMREFRSTDLESTSVVILNDVPFTGGRTGERLREFVAGGGGLLIAAGQRSGVGAWSAVLGEDGRAGSGSPVDRLNDRGGTLAVSDYDHPVFEMFSAPRSGDFSQARFFRYRSVGEVGDARVIARFDDGAVALATADVGHGRVLLFTSDLTNVWNDLPLQPVFLPFMHQMVRYLADYAPRAPSYTVGQVIDLTRSLSELSKTGGVGLESVAEEEVVVNPPSGERGVLKVGSGETLLKLEEQGFYELRSIGRDGIVLFTVAVNADPAESDLTPLDIEEFASSVTSQGGDPMPSALAASLTAAERERRQALWWYLLVVALIILVAESALSNRPARPKPIGDGNG